MNVESSPEPAQPERQRQHAGGWQGFLRWLGIGADDETSQQGENASVTYQENGSARASENGHSSEPVALKTVDQIVDEAVARHHEATKNEAGRAEGRLVPELVLGHQRYPDPSIYDPEGVTESLTVDEDYGDTVEFLLSVARDTSIPD